MNDVCASSMTLPLLVPSISTFFAILAQASPNHRLGHSHVLGIDQAHDWSARREEKLNATETRVSRSQHQLDTYTLAAVLVILTVVKFLQAWKKRNGKRKPIYSQRETESFDFVQGDSSPSDAQVLDHDFIWKVNGHTSIKASSKDSVPALWLTPFGKDWMSLLDDNVKLSSISMPGSHDTGSRYGGMYVATQSWSIQDQLESGIRFFDIRCRRDGSKFSIYHGFVYQHIDFDHVLETVKSFLESHPSETLLMRVKEECKAKDNSEAFSNIWDRYMKEDGYCSIMARNVGSSMPTLASVRGKVVVLRDSLQIHRSYGIKYNRFGNSMMDVQDYYALQGLSGMSKKKALVKEYIEKTKSKGEKLTINHCSATQIPIYTPSFVAKRTNKAAYCDIGFTVDTKENVGIIVMDFPGDHLILRILLSNFTKMETEHKFAIICR